jgi:hypothetical protein
MSSKKKPYVPADLSTLPTDHLNGPGPQIMQRGNVSRVMPQRPSIELNDVSATNCGGGLHFGSSAVVQASNVRFTNTPNPVVIARGADLSNSRFEIKVNNSNLSASTKHKIKNSKKRRS